jgi:hypothetical protein
MNAHKSIERSNCVNFGKERGEMGENRRFEIVMVSTTNN